jgi:hypothetical protein
MSSISATRSANRQVPTRATMQALGNFVLRGIGATRSSPIASGRPRSLR